MLLERDNNRELSFFNITFLVDLCSAPEVEVPSLLFDVEFLRKAKDVQPQKHGPLIQWQQLQPQSQAGNKSKIIHKVCC